MAAPVHSQATAELYEALAPLAYADAENGYALLHLLESLGQSAQLPFDWAYDVEDKAVEIPVFQELPNNNFDLSVNGWGAESGDTIVHDPTVGRTSLGSAKYTTTNTANHFGRSGPRLNGPAQQPQASQGDIITAKIWAMQDDNPSGGMQMQAHEYDASNVYLGVSSPLTSPVNVGDDGWTELSITYQVQHADCVRLRTDIDNAEVDERTFWADDYSAVHRELRSGPGFSLLLDLYRAPDEALSWLGQFVGVEFPGAGFSAATKREAIVERPRWNRGRPDAIVSAIKSSLTGTKTVSLDERVSNNAWALRITVDVAETPDIDATEAIAEAWIPAGINLTLVVAGAANLYSDVAANYVDYADVAASFATYQDLRNNNPI